MQIKIINNQLLKRYKNIVMFVRRLTEEVLFCLKYYKNYVTTNFYLSDSCFFSNVI